MKDEKDIKIKQFAIAAKRNTLKRGINLKTEMLQEKEDEKADAGGNPQRYAMSQISTRSKKAAIRGIQTVVFFERRVRNPKNAKRASENITCSNMTFVKNGTQPKKRKNGRKAVSRYRLKRRKGSMQSTIIAGAAIFLVAIIVIPIMSLAAGAYGADVSDLELTGEGSTDMVMVAVSQIGNEGGERYWRWYGFSAHVDWCAVFVSWCADQAGLIDDGSMPKFAVCDDGIEWFIEKGKWFSRNISPEPGMILFFDWDGNGRSDHVGIVEKSEDGLVYTIEGNSGDVCRRKCYAVGSETITGYGST
ncbi:MAG: CHAP domain-containing protein [Anaerovoracaceae bacterium]